MFRPAAIARVAITLLILFVCCELVQAQPGRGRGGPGGGRGPGGGGPGGGRGPGGGGPGGGFDPTEMLRRMDANGNGQLDPNEVSDRARGFLNRMTEGTGIDTSKPISIERLKRVMDERRREREREYQRSNDQQNRSRQEEEDELVVKGFELDEELPLVPGFDLPSDSPLLATGPLEDRYDKEIMERVERAFRYYDRNKDEILDKEEIKNGRWSDNPYDYDLNKDGKLSKVELCERYAKRYGNKKAESSSSSDRSSSSSSSRDSGSRSYGSRDGSRSYGSRDGSRYSSYRSSDRDRDRDDDRDDGSSKMARYAESIMRRYDRNRNGYLDKEEWKSMSGSPEKSDKNKDGKISRSELEAGLEAYAKARSSSSGSDKSRSGSSRSKSKSGSPGSLEHRFLTTDERLAELGVDASSSFVRSDKNRDGQLQMAEFAYSWSQDKLDEFKDYDLNGDGVITPQEWTTVENEK